MATCSLMSTKKKYINKNEIYLRYLLNNITFPKLCQKHNFVHTHKHTCLLSMKALFDSTPFF